MFSFFRLIVSASFCVNILHVRAGNISWLSYKTDTNLETATTVTGSK